MSAATSALRIAKTSAKSAAQSAAKEPGSLGVVGQMVDFGLSNSFNSMKEKLTTSIKDNGEKYLHDAVGKLTDSAGKVVTWGKKNPVKTAVAVAALLAVSAFLVSTVRSHGKAKAGKGVVAKVKKVARKAVTKGKKAM